MPVLSGGSKSRALTQLFLNLAFDQQKLERGIKIDRLQNGKFCEFVSFGISVHVCFGTQLGVSLEQHPTGTKMASFLSFEKWAFVYLRFGTRLGSLTWHLSRYRRQDLCDRERHCLQIARLAFMRLAFLPHGIEEWLARVDRVR